MVWCTLEECFRLNGAKFPLTVNWLSHYDDVVHTITFISVNEPLFGGDPKWVVKESDHEVAGSDYHQRYATRPRYSLVNPGCKCDWRHVILVTGCKCGGYKP